MSDSIGKASSQAFEQARKAVQKAPVAKTGSIAEFQEAMNAVQDPGMGSQKLSSEQIAKALGVESVPAGKGNVGDAILNNIEKSSSNYKQAYSELESMMHSSGPLGTTELLQVQFYMTQITVMQEIMSKITGKLTQGLQQLYRNQ